MPWGQNRKREVDVLEFALVCSVTPTCVGKQDQVSKGTGCHCFPIKRHKLLLNVYLSSKKTPLECLLQIFVFLPHFAVGPGKYMLRNSIIQAALLKFFRSFNKE